jgi:hypothetical protein
MQSALHPEIAEKKYAGTTTALHAQQNDELSARSTGDEVIKRRVASGRTYQCPAAGSSIPGSGVVCRV